MSVQKISSLSAGSSRAIELRYDRSPDRLAAIAISTLMAIGLIAWAILSPSGASIFSAIFGCVVAAVIAVGRVRLLRERKPIVVIDAMGIRDRRLSYPVIPWAFITSVDVENRFVILLSPVPTLNLGVTLHIKEGRLEFDADLPSRIYVDLAPLAVNLDEFVKHLCHFAPTLPIDQSHNNAAA